MTNGERRPNRQTQQLKRRATKQTRRSDALLGYIIPVFFVFVAGYQQVVNGQIDKYIIGILFTFGLGALGWRIDLMFEKWLEAKTRQKEQAR